MSYPWSEAEVSALREMAAAGISDPEIADRLGRTPDAVATKRKNLGVFNTYRVKPAEPWTDAEVELLTLNAHLGIEDLVAMFPHRGRHGILTKRYTIRRRLGMQQPRNLGPEPAAEDNSERPLWVPFVSTSGVKAIRTEAGIVPFVTLIHSSGIEAGSSLRASTGGGEPSPPRLAANIPDEVVA